MLWPCAWPSQAGVLSKWLNVSSCNNATLVFYCQRSWKSQWVHCRMGNQMQAGELVFFSRVETSSTQTSYHQKFVPICCNGLCLLWCSDKAILQCCQQCSTVQVLLITLLAHLKACLRRLDWTELNWTELAVCSSQRVQNKFSFSFSLGDVKEP